MRKSGRVGNDFVASAYRKEHWRARAETSICPTGVRVRHCLWATIYIRKSRGRVDGWPTVLKGTKNKDQFIPGKGRVFKEAEQVPIASPGS